jgi:diphthine methyl ester synthase
MSIPTAVQQLAEVEEKRGQGTLALDSTLAIAVSRVGGFESVSESGKGQTIVAGTLAELLAEPAESFGEPLHSLVIVGKRLHHLEVEYAEEFAVNKAHWREVAQKVYGCQLG